METSIGKTYVVWVQGVRVLTTRDRELAWQRIEKAEGQGYSVSLKVDGHLVYSCDTSCTVHDA